MSWKVCTSILSSQFFADIKNLCTMWNFSSSNISDFSEAFLHCLKHFPLFVLNFHCVSLLTWQQTFPKQKFIIIEVSHWEDRSKTCSGFIINKIYLLKRCISFLLKVYTNIVIATLHFLSFWVMVWSRSSISS